MSQYDDIMRHLDQEIARLGTELENLIITRKTMIIMYNRTVKTGKAEQVTYVKKTRKSSGIRTIPDRGAWADTRNKVTQFLEAGPAKTHDVIAHILQDIENPTKSQRDRVYGVLKELRDKGIATLDSGINTLITVGTEQ